MLYLFFFFFLSGFSQYENLTLKFSQKYTVILLYIKPSKRVFIMAVKYTQKELEWFKQEYLSGRTVEEISTDTGHSISNIKRALAEAEVIYLSWYKTKKEDEILQLLRHMNVEYADLCNILGK